ncbi:hypothetical protein LDO26_07395 [Luteimonas sp. BDR2-5]|uniref:hypothetical protein n=1 Tax=Proluteimonas luteida TaxID=2878685 RepID=UPI001E5426C0|nr:hypothetical protein [Luteimonas sp. BDR2-5]MCD9028031.1 hypothetical protein [Luteimonas sp. BDR2-5]
MQTQTPRTTPAARPLLPAAPRYAARDFGTGYGRSSGYAAARRYSQTTTPARFRVV